MLYVSMMLQGVKVIWMSSPTEWPPWRGPSSAAWTVWWASRLTRYWSGEWTALLQPSTLLTTRLSPTKNSSSAPAKMASSLTYHSRTHPLIWCLFTLCYVAGNLPAKKDWRFLSRTSRNENIQMWKKSTFSVVRRQRWDLFYQFRRLQPNRSNQKEAVKLIVMANVIELSEVLVDIATLTICNVSVHVFAWSVFTAFSHNQMTPHHVTTRTFAHRCVV